MINVRSISDRRHLHRCFITGERIRDRGLLLLLPLLLHLGIWYTSRRFAALSKFLLRANEGSAKLGNEGLGGWDRLVARRDTLRSLDCDLNVAALGVCSQLGRSIDPNQKKATGTRKDPEDPISFLYTRLDV